MFLVFVKKFLFLFLRCFVHCIHHWRVLTFEMDVKAILCWKMYSYISWNLYGAWICESNSNVLNCTMKILVWYVIDIMNEFPLLWEGWQIYLYVKKVGYLISLNLRIICCAILKVKISASHDMTLSLVGNERKLQIYMIFLMILIEKEGNICFDPENIEIHVPTWKLQCFMLFVFFVSKVYFKKSSFVHEMKNLVSLEKKINNSF